MRIHPVAEERGWTGDGESSSPLWGRKEGILSLAFLGCSWQTSCTKNHPSSYSARAQNRLERGVEQYPPRTPR
ncbi:hypothetical protein TNCV_1720771 [Trichonephila clavipes]|nr:hypothetical protein TNCV_1720771 [Trichonephila clavipes]